MIVWMDSIVFKVRENGKVINKTVYLCVGLNKEGLKEVLGMWIGKMRVPLSGWRFNGSQSPWCRRYSDYSTDT